MKNALCVIRYAKSQSYAAKCATATPNALRVTPNAKHQTRYAVKGVLTRGKEAKAACTLKDAE
jgi:hypothetical protein